MGNKALRETYLDAFNLFCGELISRGMTRHVYVNRFNPNQVVKVETDSRGHFQNINEHEIWSRVAGTHAEKWFAPVRHISPLGHVLIMDRTEPVRIAELPKRLPRYFTDLKPDNFGFINGRFVCHDYAKTRFVDEGMNTGNYKVEWRLGDS